MVFKLTLASQHVRTFGQLLMFREKNTSAMADRSSGHDSKIDGATLLMLSELDLRDPPLQIKCLGDIKRLGRAIYDLRNSHIIQVNHRPGSPSLLHNMTMSYYV
ncbi:hypothetical protein TELCIR_09504 [Teladorsagia circumcincta]|uniref:Uncharacterized protein n=1 Tax=Teladorsagia circumcincta TaxID=45464 RepID=A0A2G9UEN6_TELCI|nr:hypothetical protein TELCIR_09504 [Teladorsagia circumcincta]